MISLARVRRMLPRGPGSESYEHGDHSLGISYTQKRLCGQIPNPLDQSALTSTDTIRRWRSARLHQEPALRPADTSQRGGCLRLLPFGNRLVPVVRTLDSWFR